VGVFWYNGKGWKSKNIDEASTKGKKGESKILKDSVEGGEGTRREGGIAPGPQFTESEACGSNLIFIKRKL